VLSPCTIRRREKEEVFGDFAIAQVVIMTAMDAIVSGISHAAVLFSNKLTTGSDLLHAVTGFRIFHEVEVMTRPPRIHAV
jgi:hypothetical protein